MSDEIIVRYRWTVDELLTGHRYHFRHRVRPVFRWALWLLTVAFIVIGTLQLWQERSFFPGGFLVLVGLYIPLMFLVIRPLVVRRRFAKRPDRNTNVEWRISPLGLHSQTDYGSADLDWAALAKVVQTPKGFLFYTIPQIFHWLPRSGFGTEADFEQLAQLAKQHAAEFHTNA